MILFHFSVQTIYLGCWTDTNTFSVLDEDSYMNIGKCKTIARDNGKSICGLKVSFSKFIVVWSIKYQINKVDRQDYSNILILKPCFKSFQESSYS